VAECLEVSEADVYSLLTELRASNS
jgi:hypothetical protein